MSGRIRTHKPELYIHEELNRLEQDFPHLKPMLVFLGLMTHSDREGRFAWRPKQLKLAILPFVEFDFNATMALLVEAGLLRSYEAKGKAYGFYPTWWEHQRPNKREPLSKIPAPPALAGEAPSLFGDLPTVIGDVPHVDVQHTDKDVQCTDGTMQPRYRDAREGEREREEGKGTEEGKGERERERSKGREEGNKESKTTSPLPPVPEFLMKDLKAWGISPDDARDMAVFLGRNGLTCAVFKVRGKSEKEGKSKAGLLLKRGKELALEGHAILHEAAAKALAGAPKALNDPRWVNFPGELRDDLEVQEAWGKWIKAEADMLSCPGNDDAPRVEKAARRPLLAILAERYPDQTEYKDRLSECMAALTPSGMTAPTIKLMAMTSALGLAPQKGAK
jgi:hypothetical protein